MSMQRILPRIVTLREEFVSRLRAFIGTHFGGDWGKCFDAVSVGGRVTRGTVVMLVEKQDAQFVAENWGIVAHQVDLMDVNRDGYIDRNEFLDLNTITG